MDVSTSTSYDSEQWLVAPVKDAGASWSSRERQPRRQSNSDVDHELLDGPKERYLPDPGPGHVDFYA